MSQLDRIESMLKTLIDKGDTEFAYQPNRLKDTQPTVCELCQSRAHTTENHLKLGSSLGKAPPGLYWA